MKAWYIETELRKFRAGERGAQFDDIEGMRMRPMALSLPTEGDIPVIAKYVESLPPVRHAPILGGDAKIGKRRYALCSGCHNPDGGGNESVKAPRLAGLDDWYLATELKKFRGGVRGADPRDEEGTAMAPMAKSREREGDSRHIRLHQHAAASCQFGDAEPMNHADPSSDQTFKTVFWIVMTTAAAFVAAAWIMIR